MQWYGFYNEPAGGTDPENGKFANEFINFYERFQSEFDQFVQDCNSI